MKAVPLPAALFTLNRANLVQKMRPRSVAVLNANDIMPTNADGSMGHLQNADLFYLTGIHQEETILVLAPDAYDPNQREILFVRQPNEHLATWVGHKLTREQATALSGIKNVRWLEEFPVVFRMLACELDNIYLNSNEHQRADVTVETRDVRFIRDCQRQFPLHHYQRLAQLLYELRMVKSPYEIDAIQAACDLTNQGFRRVCKFLQPGVNECEVEAEFAHEFIRHKGQFAYPPIIAGGVNNNILHYNQNDQPCKKGELLLLDVAAGLGNYMSDMTRTIPVSGRFSRRQRQVYDAVLRIFRHQVAALVPGKTTKDLRLECDAVTTKECVDLGLLKMSQVKKQTPEHPAVMPFFMHGISHPIGLDVHDATYNQMKIQPGWVLSVEPGIYIKAEGFGVRLENTVLVTEDGQRDLMAGIPIAADEIEALMHRR
jgi:Xaa-Pro aminopeptidase